jgi:tripartite-type tricarboxylate transporter receptor subunit TctC
MKKSLALLAAAAASFVWTAVEAAYPEKPVRLILGVGPGGAPDITARIFTTKLSEILGQQVVVDNRPGAGGLIGMEAVARSAPDGYTLFMCGVSQAIRPVMHKKLVFDVVRDFTRISLYGAVPNILVVHPSVPARTLADFVSYARANPGKLRYGSSGVGLSPHLTMEYFRTLAKIDLLHVPYKTGAQAVNEVVAGEVHTQFNNFPTQLANIKAGRVRPIAITSLKRNETLPDVPTFDESGYPGFEITVWYGLCGPAKMPAAITGRLATSTAKALLAPDLRQRYVDHGVEPRDWAGEKFDTFYKSEVARWGKVARDAGIKPE